VSAAPVPWQRDATVGRQAAISAGERPSRRHPSVSNCGPRGFNSLRQRVSPTYRGRASDGSTCEWIDTVTMLGYFPKIFRGWRGCKVSLTSSGQAPARKGGGRAMAHPLRERAARRRRLAINRSFSRRAPALTSVDSGLPRRSNHALGARASTCLNRSFLRPAPM
jgi:hypothetical protein